MKLYTEEQVRTILDLAKLSVNGDEKYSKDELLEKLTPIELPSDKEIEETFTFYPQMIEGAKWMRDKLTNIKEK